MTLKSLHNLLHLYCCLKDNHILTGQQELFPRQQGAVDHIICQARAEEVHEASDAVCTNNERQGGQV